MGFIDNYRKARDGVPGWEFALYGQKVTCSHCGSTFFEDRRAQLNTAGLTFLKLDWANESATVLVCMSCGRLEWFLSDPEKLK